MSSAAPSVESTHSISSSFFIGRPFELARVRIPDPPSTLPLSTTRSKLDEDKKKRCSRPLHPHPAICNDGPATRVPLYCSGPIPLHLPARCVRDHRNCSNHAKGLGRECAAYQ
jgi:hypothetical protein